MIPPCIRPLRSIRGEKGGKVHLFSRYLEDQYVQDRRKENFSREGKNCHAWWGMKALGGDIWITW